MSSRQISGLNLASSYRKTVDFCTALKSNQQFAKQRRRHNAENRKSMSLDDIAAMIEEEKPRKIGIIKKSKSVYVKISGRSDHERIQELIRKHRTDRNEAEILHNCAEYDQKHSSLNSSNKPDKFPVADDVVELRRSETIVNRREHAQTIHETSNTRKFFTADGPYKLKAENKTKLKVENGKVEVREHEIQFWSNGCLLRTEMIEGDVSIDKQITYRTKDGVRVVTFKIPLSKQEPSVVDSRNFLRKFLRRRSDKHLLEKKGILKNENVFGNKLSVLKDKFGQAVPPFVRTIMNYIEQEENVRSEHIYRISGNMAVIQKIRLQIDESNFKILEKHAKEIEVLTGTLKLFYRELVDPILPYKDFEKLNKILDKVLEGEERSKQVVEVVDNIDSPNRENLKELIGHLLKIEENSSYNKMTLKSLAIVWGPSVIWYQQDKCPNYNAIDFSMLANRIVELIFTSHRTLVTERQPAVS